LVYIYVSLWGKQDATHTNIFSLFNLQIMEHKTVLEFFAQAIIDGHEWAPAAMKNLARDSRDWPFDFAAKEKVADLYEALWMSFHWEQSPEGAKYWREIADKLLPE
jgi:hypothetical protein